MGEALATNDVRAAIVRRLRERAAELRALPVGALGNATARVRAIELERMADEIEGGEK